MDYCTPQGMGVKMLIIGVILVLVRMYTVWDIWLVIGAIIGVKGLIMILMPKCTCTVPKKKK